MLKAYSDFFMKSLCLMYTLICPPKRKHICSNPPFKADHHWGPGVASARDIHCAVLKPIQWVSNVYNMRITFSRLLVPLQSSTN